MVLAILLTVVASISVNLLNRARTMQWAAARKSSRHLAMAVAENLRARYEVYLDIALDMAAIMSGYEMVAPELRRTLYNSNMLALINSNDRIIQMYTVWKPNAIDNMDAQFAGQPGNTPAGQYVAMYSKVSGQNVFTVYEDYERTTEDLSETPRIGDPVSRVVAGKQTYTCNIQAPVCNSKKELVANVGSPSIWRTPSRSSRPC
jgi:methyl-accepting chemotaxis protein